MSETLGLFGYGSLVLAESASMTLGRPAGEMRPARLHRWRRRFSQRRDNLTCEKTFECAGGWRPEWILGLNVEDGEDDAGPVNGVVIELTEAELDRLDIREIRYDRVDVTGSVDGEGLPGRIVTYTAKEFHFAPEPPGGLHHPRDLRRGRRARLRVAGPRRARSLPGDHPVHRRPPRGHAGDRQDPGRKPARLVIRPGANGGPNRAAPPSRAPANGPCR